MRGGGVIIGRLQNGDIFLCSGLLELDVKQNIYVPELHKHTRVSHFPLLPSKLSSEPLQDLVEIPSPMCF